MFNIAALLTQGVIRRNVTIDDSNPVFTWDLLDEVFGGVAPTRKAIVTITVTSQTDIVSSNTVDPCMDLTGLPADSQIILINNGSIYGSGGDGGRGGNNQREDETECTVIFADNGVAGGAGGNAILYDGSNVSLDIENASGRIWGGGGGGGGGDSCANLTACLGNGGGGGGGGAGGHSTGGKVGGAGAGGVSTKFGLPSGDNGDPGQAGTPGPTGGGGAGGASGTYSGCFAGAGGAGGDFGEAGNQGGAGGASGGGAGLAVKNNGTGSTTFLSGGSQGSDVKGVVQ